MAYRDGSNFKSVLFKRIVEDNSFATHCENSLKWMPEIVTDEKSIY